MADQLFPTGPLEVSGPDPGPPLSADRRRTIKRAELLELRIHPTTRVPLVPIVDVRTCADCPHHFAHGRGARTYHKCRRTPGGLTHGPGSDVRVGWPACTLIDQPSREATTT